MRTAIRSAIDRSGRLVVLKAIRDELGIVAGTPLLLSVRDGRIEIEPAYAEVEIVERDGLVVAERVDSVPSLAEEQVRATRERLREREA